MNAYLMQLDDEHYVVVAESMGQACEKDQDRYLRQRQEEIREAQDMGSDEQYDRASEVFVHVGMLQSVSLIGEVRE